MSKYTVDLEKFDKSEDRQELDKLLRRLGKSPTGPVTVQDNILSTYEKYMWEYGCTDIAIRTDEFPAGVLLIGVNTIKITTK